MPDGTVTQARTGTSERRPSFELRRRAERAWNRRDEPRFRLQVALATVFALAVGAFAHVAEDYLDKDPIVRWDVEFSRWLHVHSSPTLLQFFKLYTYAGNIAFLALLTIAVAVSLLRRGAVNEALLMAVSALGIELLNGGLKLLFHRPRPKLSYVHLDTYSFPSGHATGSAAIYGVALYLLVTLRRRSGRRYLFAALGYVVVVALIGFSRLYLEAHYLSDVLAGTALGITWASGCLFVYEARGRFDATRLLPARANRLLTRIAAE